MSRVPEQESGDKPRKPQHPERPERQRPDQKEDDTQERWKRAYWTWARRLQSEDRRVWAPWLFMRYKESTPTYLSPDVGLRPIPPGEPFWVSPDIWVESSDPYGNAVAGEENFVHARIFNLGKATSAPTQIDFYWADPSMGLGPSNMVHIGTEWQEIEAHSARDIRCNKAWVPQFLNNGHECLMVNCSNPMMLQPGQTYNFAPTFDPIKLPFQPQLDRHVAQRNIHVVQGKGGQMVKFSVFVNNLFPNELRTLVTAHIEHVVVARTALKTLELRDIINHVAAFGFRRTNSAVEMRERFREGTDEYRQAQQIAKFASHRRDTGEGFVRRVQDEYRFARTTASISSRWTGHSRVIQSEGAGANFGNLLLAEDKLASQARSADASRDIVLQELSMGPYEQRQLDLELGVPADLMPGEFVVYSLAHRTGGLVIGGYTIVMDGGFVTNNTRG